MGFEKHLMFQIAKQQIEAPIKDSNSKALTPTKSRDSEASISTPTLNSKLHKINLIKLQARDSESKRGLERERK